MPSVSEPILRDIPPIISTARYAKNMMAVACRSKDAYKTRAERLAESLANGRYSQRENAYILSKTKAAKLQKLYEEGWDARSITGELFLPEEQQQKMS